MQVHIIVIWQHWMRERVRISLITKYIIDRLNRNNIRKHLSYNLIYADLKIWSTLNRVHEMISIYIHINGL